MSYMPVTSFRRPVSAAQLQHVPAPDRAPLPRDEVNKWDALRELTVARRHFDLSDRDLAVLQALISFHPKPVLSTDGKDLVVHPSNRSICERLNGMPCSTMRRHLATLVRAGVITRRDSPNGKRYARRYGDDKIAYGFDLSPLVHRFPEICALAEDARAETQAMERLRETIRLMRRDLAGLAEFGAEQQPQLEIWAAFSDLATLTARALRRKLTLTELQALETRLADALTDLRVHLEVAESEEMSTKGVQNEQHYKNTKLDSYESERPAQMTPNSEVTRLKGRKPTVPIGLVLATCSEFRTYCDYRILHWNDLVRAADIIRPMMGICVSAWDEAKEMMGPENAAIALVAMLERFESIKSPGGYLRTLSRKAADGTFSCGPMIMALARKDG
ncbi:MAG: plasmid replication protein RepC [Marinibacterium sp.]|nr:plasmid replication protein RepC [Marinibacterium sp.]